MRRSLLRVNRADNARRITGDDRVLGNVFRDHRSRPDHRVFADRDASKNNGSAAYPHVITHRDRQGTLPKIDAILNINRVGGGEELAAGTDEHIVADGNGGYV